MDNRKKAKEAMLKAFRGAAEVFRERFRAKLSFSRFKKLTQSSIYSRHQGAKERERRLRQYPSLDLARMGH